MPFRKINVQWSAGEAVPPANVPQALKNYCDALANVPPKYEYYIGDPDYDLKTLHSSAGFRDAFARLGGTWTEMSVDWQNPTQHEISGDGMRWTKVLGTAWKYVVTYTPARGAPQTVYMSIQFGA